MPSIVEDRARELLTRRHVAGSQLFFAQPRGRPAPEFSEFRPRDLARGIALAGEMAAIARANPGDPGLLQALQIADQTLATDPLDLVKYAIMVFIVHYPEARGLPIPPIEERAPEMVMLSRPQPRALAQPSTPVSSPPPPPPTERDLDWYREDIFANEHHDFWHVVYPYRGIVKNGQPNQIQSRQGELFFYMHQQMLARYRAEREGVRLPALIPYGDFATAIAEEYDSGLSGFVPRAPRMTPANIAGLTVADHTQSGNRLDQAAQAGHFDPSAGGAVVTPPLLGAATEASVASVSSTFYGDYHNGGHDLIASVMQQTGRPGYGVMIRTATAIRDPVFYRWHQQIDNLGFEWQETQPPNDFSDAPNVRIRPKDIIFAFKDLLPGSDQESFGPDYGEEHFGGQHWDADFTGQSPTTDVLETSMSQRTITDPALGSVTVEYLDQREFVYFFRVENLADVEQDITLRVFLARTAVADQRREWIELDKFKATLDANQKAVIYRPSALSSVIRKPASKPVQPVQARQATTGWDDQNYCQCGWPFNLLIPRGTRAPGMDFRLFIMVTDWNRDSVSQSTCGSMSFCGAKDDYPDLRGMGYPFDRPFPVNNNITSSVATLSNVALRDLKIEWV